MVLMINSFSHMKYKKEKYINSGNKIEQYNCVKVPISPSGFTVTRLYFRLQLSKNILTVAIVLCSKYLNFCIKFHKTFISSIHP